MEEPITITMLNNKIYLDEECWNCINRSNRNKEAIKIKKDETFYTDGVCEVCKGKKYVLTEVGQAIIDLIKRHSL